MTPAPRPTLRENLRSFHEDEDGMETLQTVMIVGVAALILIVLIAFWKPIKSWFNGVKAKWQGESNSID